MPHDSLQRFSEAAQPLDSSIADVRYACRYRSSARFLRPRLQGSGMHLQASSAAILVNRRQEGNPLLKCIRNVRWQYRDVIPDYQLGSTSCAIFLSLRLQHRGLLLDAHHAAIYTIYLPLTRVSSCL